tara:strand:- start:144 stop:1757 length:1614 start_codon:yes stop_codon:yes gene_type:complete
MFYNAKLFNQPLNRWDTQNVTNMTALFADTEHFNQSINSWNTENVQSMSGMFARTKEFNQPLDNWNTSNVIDMSGMFSTTFSFNQPLINWDVSKVNNMSSMFETSVFNQDIGSWNVSNVTNMLQMFYQASNFNQDIGSWDVSNVDNMLTMFAFTPDFNQNLSEWDVSNVQDMGAMFFKAESFDQNIGDWNISKVEAMVNMLYESGISLKNYDKTLIGWSNLTSLQSNVIFNAETIQYCESEQARQYLIATYGWTITDGGKAPLCNEDNDLDGILDHLDTCIETRPNVTVNDNGCEIIASDAILVYGATPTCPGEANGSIKISSSLTDYIFNIAVEGPISTDYNEVSLNENLEIASLTTGLYTVTISIPDISYSQTYGIQINQVGTISGKRESLNTTAKTASYNVEGSYTYTVDVNGELKNYNFTSNGKNEIQITGLAEFNAISITGESDCQGKVTDSFAFLDGIIMYPTITSGEVFVEGFEESSTVLVYDLSGRLVLSKELSELGSNSIDFQVLESGIYPTVIQSKELSKTFKIIKQ